MFSTLNPYSNTSVPPYAAPNSTSAAARHDSTNHAIWVWPSSKPPMRSTSPSSVSAVTTIITVACQLIVRQTWVCFAFPIGPLARSRGMPFHQSRNPVNTAPRPTM